MRILPINNIAFNNPINTNKKQIKNSSSNNAADLNLLNKNYMQITFGAVSKTSLEFVQKIPLEDRLASMFEKMENGTITGKDKRNFRIIQEDFDIAIQKFLEKRNADRKPIGFIPQ